MNRQALMALSLAWLTAQAPAPSGRDAIRQACDPDVRRYCPEAAGNPSRIRVCLTSEPVRLAAACRVALQSAGILPP